jgi:hypothetical protein
VARAISAGAQAPLALYVSAPTPLLQRAFSTALGGASSAKRLAPLLLEAKDAGEAETAARGLWAHSLMRLELDLVQGSLRARGDLFGVTPNFWSGRHPQRPSSPSAVLLEAVPADAVALALAQPGVGTGAGSSGLPSSLGTWQAVKLSALPQPPGALGCGDLDGDGHVEVVLLVEPEVWTLDSQGALRAKAALWGIPPALKPTRDPYGTVSIDPATKVALVVSGRRAAGARVTLKGKQLEVQSEPVGDSLKVRIQQGTVVLDGSLAPGRSALSSLWTGSANLRLPKEPVTLSVHPAQGAPEWLAVHTDSTGQWGRLSEPAQARTLPTLGSASALVDLDGDGRPEVATTSAQLEPLAEEIRFLSREGAELPGRVALPSRALTMAVCAAGGEGESLLVGLWLKDGTGEVWRVSRRARE